MKALDRYGDCYKYLSVKFPAFAEVKIKKRIFVQPQIRALDKDKQFQATMTVKEKNTWNAFKKVRDNSLGNNEHLTERL